MKDYLKKEPTKTEKMLYETYMHLQHLDRSLVSNSAHMVALSILLDIKPEKLAEVLVNQNDKIQAYGKQINQIIDELEKKKKDSEEKTVQDEKKSE